MIKVENFEGKNNQFVIQADDEIIFQSYSTIIARCIPHNNGTFTITIDTRAEHYSPTTSKYLYKFLQQYGINVYNKKDLWYALKNNKIFKENLNQ